MYAYVIIHKDTGFCFQVNKTPRQFWVLNTDTMYNIPVDFDTASLYLGKYFYDGKWWRREWVYVDGEQTEEYTDFPWTPEVVA